MDQAGIIIAEAGLLALLCLLTARQAREQRRDFEAELAATRAGEYPPEVAYRYYRRASSRRFTNAFMWYCIILVLFIAVVMSLAISNTSAVASFEDLSAPPSPTIATFFALMGPVLIAPLLLLSWLSADGDVSALTQLQGLPTHASDLRTFRLKRNALLILPLLLALELGVALYLSGVSSLRCWIGGIYLMIGAYVAIVLLGAPISRWLYRTEPIERTQWAEVGVRAHAWARQVGVPLRKVYVRRIEKLGWMNNSITLRSPHTLSLSDTFLNHSEWRQRDALICQLLVSRHPTQRRRLSRILRLQLTLAALIGVAAIGYGVIVFLVNPMTLSTVYVLPVLAASMVLNGLNFTLLAFNARTSDRRTIDDAIESDQAIIALCGDPLALAATLVTTLRLQGIDLESSFLSARWTQKDHILAIERTLRQPGPYAPWAFQPILTMEPLPVEPALEAFPLSVPLMAASGDERSAPVPETRYPVTDSPWQGAPEQGS